MDLIDGSRPECLRTNAWSNLSETPCQVHLLLLAHPPAFDYSNFPANSFIPLQCLPGPVPQLSGQLGILGQLVVRPGDTHWFIVASICDGVLPYRRGPQLVLDSLLDRNHPPPRARPYKGLVRQAEVCHQSRVDDAWMDGRGRDLRVTPCNLRGIQNVGQL